MSTLNMTFVKCFPIWDVKYSVWWRGNLFSPPLDDEDDGGEQFCPRVQRSWMRGSRGRMWLMNMEKGYVWRICRKDVFGGYVKSCCQYLQNTIIENDIRMFWMTLGTISRNLLVLVLRTLSHLSPTILDNLQKQTKKRRKISRKVQKQ